MNATIDGLRQHFEVHGSGAPVLLIHGFPLSGALWTPTVERLEDRYRCIVPDLRGHGASEGADDAGMGRLAEDLALLLDHLGVDETVALVGLSMGGYVALEMCRRFPDRVGSLVLVDTRAEADGAEAARGRLATAERVLREGSAGFAEGMAQKLFASGAPEALRQQWRAVMAATPPSAIAAALRGMAARRDSHETLGRLSVPVLLVVGEEDSITPPDAARAMQASAPRARLEVVAGAGHMTPVEQPDRFAEILLSFLPRGT